MDLIESTLQVAENANLQQEHLASYKQNLDQYEEYIKQLKDNLQEIQEKSIQNEEVLNINNFTKNIYNENYKETKALFGLIYGYVQQIEENLSTISQSESSLDELYNENNQRINRIETNFNNARKVLETMKKNTDERFSKYNADLEFKINKINVEIAECEEVCKNLEDRCEEKEETLNSIKSEIEMIQNNIDEEIEQQVVLIDERKLENQKILEEITTDIDLDKKIFEVQEEIIAKSQKLKDVMDMRGAVIQKLKESEKAVENLKNACSDLQAKIAQAENENKEISEKLMHDIQSNQALIAESEAKLASFKDKTCELEQEKEQTNTKLSALEVELQILDEKNSAAEEKLIWENTNSEKLWEENENLVKLSEELIIKISENANVVKRKQEELDLLRNTPNPEQIELKTKVKELDVGVKKSELKKEIEDVDLNNKKLQQSVEQNEAAIKELTKQKVEAEEERHENQKRLKNLMSECENAEKELRYLEAAKKENLKKIPIPPPKHPRPAKNIERKRGFTMEIESDSSVDGERLSYAEFMARKKLKGSKKQKK